MNLLTLRAFFIRHAIWIKVLIGCYIGVLIALSIHPHPVLAYLGLVLVLMFVSIALVMHLTGGKE